MSDRIPDALRARVWRAARGYCYLCQGQLGPLNLADWHADHVIPRALGGPSVLGNLRATHPICNRRKSDQIVALPPGPARRAVGRVYAIAGRLGEQGLHMTPLPILLPTGARVSTLRFILPTGAAHLTPRLDAEVRAAIQHADQIMDVPPTHDRAIVTVDGRLLVVQVPRRAFRPTLHDHLPTPTGGRFAIGIDMLGRPVWASIGQGSAPHWLVAGATDSGKSAAMLTIAHQAARGGARLALADVDGWGTFAALAGAMALWRAPAEGAADATELIMAVRAEMEAREPGREHQPLVLLVDELHMLGKAAMRALGEIVLGGRKRRVHLVLSSHYPKSDQVARITTQQVGHRLCLRVEDAVASRTIIERDGAERLLGRGHALYRHAGVVTCLQVALTLPENCARLPRALHAPAAASTVSVRARVPVPVAAEKSLYQATGDLLEEARRLVAAGELVPAARQIRLRFGIGQNKARQIRDALAST